MSPPRSVAKDALFTTASLSGAAFALVLLGTYLARAHPPRDAFGYLLGRDFVNDWMGGRAMLQHQLPQLFDVAAYQHRLQDLFPGLPWQNWSYPPHLLLLLWPFALLPYLWAYLAWILAGLAALYAAARTCGMDRGGLLFLFTAPAVTVNLITGQNGCFTAALLIASVSLLDSRPLLAGLLIALLTVKPQLGLLIPLMLAVSGRWRVLVVASLATATLVALSCAVLGVDAWRDFIGAVMPYQRLVLERGGGLMLAMMPTAFIDARLAGASAAEAYLAQLPFTLLALAAVVWTFCRRREPALSSAVLVTASFVATPYVFNYDMVVFGWVLWQLRGELEGRLATSLIVLNWWLPVLCVVLGLERVPLAALGPAALLLWQLQRLRAREAARSAAELATAG